MRSHRRLLVMGAVVAALAGSAFLYATEVTSSGAAARHSADDPAGRSVPMSAAGFLAVVSSGHATSDGTGFQAGAERLIVVHPDGTRSVLRTVHPDPTSAEPGLQLLDVSGDGRVALVEVREPSGESLSTVDTGTGRIIHRLRAGSRLLGALLEPDGTGVLEVRQIPRSDRYQLARTGWDGKIAARTLVDTSVAWLTPSGDVLVPAGAGRHALRLFDGDSGALDHVVTTGDRDCRPVRSYDATSVLLSCGGGEDGLSTLFRLDASVGTLVPVTRTHPADRRFYGDNDVRVTEVGTFVQEDGPCGWSWFTRQGSDGRLAVQHVRGARGEVYLVGVLGSLPVVLDATGCDTGEVSRQVLATYDPRTHRQHVLTAWRAGQLVGSVVPLGERRAAF